MHTLHLFNNNLKNIPTETTWYLSDLSEAKGKQELFINQSPQKLKVLREHAIIESAVSSNRIEGVEIDRDRIGTVIFGRPYLKDRNEEEVQGYRDALQWIHEDGNSIRLNQTSIKKIHSITRGKIWDAGKYKNKDGDIIERLSTGDVRIRFKTVKAKATPSFMKELFALYNECLKQSEVHKLLIIAGFNLDFLCIHPFRDGNGRVSRLLLLLQLYHAGFEVGRYISLERLIEEYKERYYETLEISSQGWHEKKHNPWPYVNYLLYILKKAYEAFGNRVESMDTPRGAKTALIIDKINNIKGEFTLSMLVKNCPDVSKDMIRKVMKELQKQGIISSTGKGPGARWKKMGNNIE